MITKLRNQNKEMTDTVRLHGVSFMTLSFSVKNSFDLECPDTNITLNEISLFLNSVFLLSLISYQKDYIYVNMINAFSISFHCVNCIASEVCVIFDIALSLKNHYSNKM